jgi:hypothetical protein
LLPNHDPIIRLSVSTRQQNLEKWRIKCSKPKNGPISRLGRGDFQGIPGLSSDDSSAVRSKQRGSSRLQ